MKVLVCIKRVPAVAGRITLTDDERAIDAKLPRVHDRTPRGVRRRGGRPPGRGRRRRGGRADPRAARGARAAARRDGDGRRARDPPRHRRRGLGSGSPRPRRSSRRSARTRPRPARSTSSSSATRPADSGGYQVAIRIGHALGPTGPDRPEGRCPSRTASSEASGPSRVVATSTRSRCRPWRRCSKVSTSRAIPRCPAGFARSPSPSRRPRPVKPAQRLRLRPADRAAERRQAGDRPRRRCGRGARRRSTCSIGSGSSSHGIGPRPRHRRRGRRRPASRSRRSTFARRSRRRRRRSTRCSSGIAAVAGELGGGAPPRSTSPTTRRSPRPRPTRSPRPSTPWPTSSAPRPWSVPAPRTATRSWPAPRPGPGCRSPRTARAAVRRIADRRDAATLGRHPARGSRDRRRSRRCSPWRRTPSPPTPHRRDGLGPSVRPVSSTPRTSSSASSTGSRRRRAASRWPRRGSSSAAAAAPVRRRASRRSWSWPISWAARSAARAP